MSTHPRDEGAHDPPEPGLVGTFDETHAAGYRRLSRPWHSMLATGLMGGLEVGMGVLAMLYVLHETGSQLLAGLAFSVGFLALLLGRSELFTEDFLVPVTTVATRHGRVRNLLRLWGVTLVTNLLGGWIIMALIMTAFPKLHTDAVESGTHFAELGVNAESFALAVLAGAAMTLMTWMQIGAESELGRIAAAVAVAFLVVGTELFHSVVDSLLMFAALHTGQATFGYADWAVQFGWATLGNMVGGIVLITGLRLVQTGARVRQHAHPEASPPE